MLASKPIFFKAALGTYWRDAGIRNRFRLVSIVKRLTEAQGAAALFAGVAIGVVLIEAASGIAEGAARERTCCRAKAIHRGRGSRVHAPRYSLMLRAADTHFVVP